MATYILLGLSIGCFILFVYAILLVIGGIEFSEWGKKNAYLLPFYFLLFLLDWIESIFDEIMSWLYEEDKE